MKFLFPVDGSECSLSALDRFIDILPALDGKPDITLIYVHPQLPYPRAVAWAGAEVVKKYYDEESDTALAKAQKRMELTGLPFKVEKRIGDPAHEIVKFAEKETCAIIAMGTHGRSALSNLLMGSVATKVLAAGKVPVLFLK